MLWALLRWMAANSELVQKHTAVFLTAGEFAAAIFLVIHDGHILAFYLAATYAMRETKGGKHYHEVVLDMIAKLRYTNRCELELRKVKDYEGARRQAD